MANVANSDRYIEIREKIEDSFKNKYSVYGKSIQNESPCGNYKLLITYYKTEKGCWDYTKGVVFDKNGEEIFTIFRNYSSFIYKWVEHQNGNTYLLCGEDYQGYVVLNLTQKIKHVYFPESGFKGCGFCWVNIEDYDEHDSTITVEGCYWGFPYEKIVYNFSNPDKVPFEEILRYDVDTNDDEEDTEVDE